MRFSKCIITGKVVEVADCKLEFNKIELAWAAGFFDGEGCITSTAKANNGCWSFRVNVTQVDKRPLKRFIRAIGFGKLYTSNAGFIIEKSIVEFSNFEKAQAVMAILWQYLSEPKKEQYKRCIKAYLASGQINRRSLGANKAWVTRRERQSQYN